MSKPITHNTPASRSTPAELGTQFQQLATAIPGLLAGLRSQHFDYPWVTEGSTKIMEGMNVILAGLQSLSTEGQPK